MELRNYQRKIVNDVLSTEDNVLVTLPTGAGKTVVANEIIKHVKETVLFIVPKLELINQAAKTFGEPVDVIWSNKTHIEGRHIIVASKQTLMLRKNLELPKVCIIVDEVHIGLQSLKSILDRFSYTRVIGLTATAERMDGRSFIVKDKCKNKFNKSSIYDYAVFERVIDWCTVQELQKDGYLSPINIELNPNAFSLSKIKSKHSYDDELDTDVIMSGLGEHFFDFVAKAKQFKGKPTLVFTPDLKMMELVVETLNKSGLYYSGISGAMSVEERKLILNDLESGIIDGVVNCGVLTTGFDMPCVKQCILIRNIKSRPLLYQILGRFIRPYNNETAYVYDFAGSCFNFATADNPDLFSKPIEWRYEGFEIKDKEMRSESDEVMDVVLDECNVSWTEYLNDPVNTLLNCLINYKEAFERSLFEQTNMIKKDAEEKIKNVVESVDKIAEQKAEKYISNAEEIAKKRLEEQCYDPVGTWFGSQNGFDWFRSNFAKILREYQWDCSEFKAGDKECEKRIEEIYLHTIPKLPLKNLEDNERLREYFHERTYWWFTHFKLNIEDRMGKVSQLKR